MNSLPTVSPSQEFDPQWELMKQVVLQSGMNMRLVNMIIESLIKVNTASGYGSITMSIMGGYLQEFKVTMSEKIGETIRR